MALNAREYAEFSDLMFRRHYDLPMTAPQAFRALQLKDKYDGTIRHRGAVA